jgi:sporulation protein YlmC with PRC-barrel domain
VNDQGRENRLTGPIDGVLNLLDRQLLDSDGKMLGKVDDVELTQQEDGLAITAVLTGPAALLHRLGGQLGSEMVTKWEQARPSEPNRSRPWRIEVSDIDRLDSAVHLSVPRDGILNRDTEGHRLGRLAGMKVLGPDGHRIGYVIDARFQPGHHERLVLRSLIVGRGGPGSLLGYDRHRGQGPWLVRAIVGFLHRHSRLIDLDDVQILWNNQQVQLHRPPSPKLERPFAD